MVTSRGVYADGRYWPNVGWSCTRCQRTVDVYEKSERFRSKGGRLLVRHVGKCPVVVRPHVYKRERMRRYEERCRRQREAEERTAEAMRRFAAAARPSQTWTTVEWDNSSTYSYTMADGRINLYYA